MLSGLTLETLTIDLGSQLRGPCTSMFNKQSKQSSVSILFVKLRLIRFKFAKFIETAISI